MPSTKGPRRRGARQGEGKKGKGEGKGSAEKKDKELRRGQGSLLHSQLYRPRDGQDAVQGIAGYT